MFYVIVAKLGEITFHSTTGYVEAFLCRPPCFVYIIAQVLLELIFLHPSIKRYENYFYLYYFYLDFPACLSLGLGSVKWFYIDYTKHNRLFYLDRPFSSLLLPSLVKYVISVANTLKIRSFFDFIASRNKLTIILLKESEEFRITNSIILTKQLPPFLVISSWLIYMYLLAFNTRQLLLSNV